MKLLSRLICVLVLCVAIPVLAAEKDVLSPKEAAKILGRPDIVLVDVRTPGEFAEGHLKGAVNINFFGPRFEYDIQKLPKDKTLLLYCKTGVRSARAAEMIREEGERKVFDLGGGIQAWRKAGMPVEK